MLSILEQIGWAFEIWIRPCVFRQYIHFSHLLFPAERTKAQLELNTWCYSAINDAIMGESSLWSRRNLYLQGPSGKSTVCVFYGKLTRSLIWRNISEPRCIYSAALTRKVRAQSYSIKCKYNIDSDPLPPRVVVDSSIQLIADEETNQLIGESDGNEPRAVLGIREAFHYAVN